MSAGYAPGSDVYSSRSRKGAGQPGPPAPYHLKFLFSSYFAVHVTSCFRPSHAVHAEKEGGGQKQAGTKRRGPRVQRGDYNLCQTGPGDPERSFFIVRLERDEHCIQRGGRNGQAKACQPHTQSGGTTWSDSRGLSGLTVCLPDTCILSRRHHMMELTTAAA